MNDEATLICEECAASYLVEEAYATFRSDFESRVGFAFTGRRPPWIRRFCSESCRFTVERRRVEGHNRTSAAKRKAERAVRSLDPNVE